jgi:hypothetical protein
MREIKRHYIIIMNVRKIAQRLAHRFEMKKKIIAFIKLLIMSATRVQMSLRRKMKKRGATHDIRY